MYTYFKRFQAIASYLRFPEFKKYKLWPGLIAALEYHKQYSPLDFRLVINLTIRVVSAPSYASRVIENDRHID